MSVAVDANMYAPAIPFKAIYVEGLPSQNVIEIEQEEAEDVVIDDFGF